MDSTKRVLKFQTYGMKKSVGVFWSVLLTINIFTYILIGYFNSNIRIGIFDSRTNTFSIVAGNIMPIFIFLIVYGIVMYHEDFALALNFGVTRKDFYKSVIFNNLLVILIFSVIQSTLQVIDKNIMGLLGYKPMVEFSIFNISTDNIWFIMLTLALLFLTIASITNLLGILQYRFGYKLWIGLGVVFTVGQIMGNFTIKTIIALSEILLWLQGKLHYPTVLIIGFAIIIICYILGYFLIKKANIKK